MHIWERGRPTEPGYYIFRNSGFILGALYEITDSGELWNHAMLKKYEFPEGKNWDEWEYFKIPS